MKKISDSKNINSAATAGLTTLILLVLQSKFSPTFLNGEVSTVLSPIFAGTFVFIMDWLFAKYEFKSPATMRAISDIDKTISFLKEELDHCDEKGLSKSKIEAEYNKAVKAKSQLLTHNYK